MWKTKLLKTRIVGDRNWRVTGLRIANVFRVDSDDDPTATVNSRLEASIVDARPATPCVVVDSTPEMSVLSGRFTVEATVIGIVPTLSLCFRLHM